MSVFPFESQGKEEMELNSDE